MSKRRGASRKPFQLRDRHVCLLLVALSVLVRLPFLKTYDMVSYDGTYYINHARTILGAMDRPSGFPIGYPIFIALFIPIIRDGVRAAQTVSFLAGLGSLFVFYFLAKRFVRRDYALAGVAILALTPLFISLSMMTMSESIYVLWLLLGLLCYSKEKYLLSGLFIGFAAITRPEALGVLGLLAVLVLRRPKRLLWIVAGFACVYCINVAIQSGTAGKLILVSKTNLFGTSASSWKLREAWVDFPGKEKALEEIGRKGGTSTVPVDYLKRMPREFVLLVLHVSPVVFLLSLYGMFRRRSFLLAALAPFFVFPLFTFRSEPRFILPYVPPLILYSFIGLEGVRRRVVHRCLIALLVVSAAASFLVNRDQLMTPVSQGEQGAKREGLHFSAVVSPEDVIADRKPFFAFYAGGRYLEIPVGPYDETLEHLSANKVKYLFLDRRLVDVARPNLKPLLYDRAVIAGEMRFSQRAFNPGGIVIYERAMDTEPLKRRYLIPPVDGTISGISWSPDGKKIAYRLIEASGTGGIYVMSSDGSARRLLVADPVTENQIAWSPDSKRIAFAMAKPGSLNIYISDESGNVTQVTSNPGGNTSPSWSKDGNEMVFCSDRSGRYDIWSKNLDTGAMTQITKNGGNISPAFSPDARKIAWIRDGEGVCIYERGTGVIARGESPKKVYFVPAWSPDGRMIAVMGKDWRMTDIYLLTADGRSTLLLTKSVMMGTPTWSPDGQALAVATREDNKMGIAVLTNLQPYKDRLMNPMPIYVFQETP
jgi:hypothetical protein